MQAMKPTSEGSRVSVSSTGGDSLQAGQARVRLKLAAIAYVNCQIGVEASLDLATAGLELLCESAVCFWEVVTKQKFTRKIDLSAATRLRVAALGYVNSRHGVDATTDIARAGMEALCQASVRYCESLSV